LVICAHLGLGPVGWLLKKLLHRPYWIIVYGIEAWQSLPFLKQTALRRAEKIPSISNFTREQILKRYAFAGDRVIILTPCLTDEALLSVPPSEELLHQLIQEGRRIILTVARLDGSERYKGHEVVVRAL